MPRGANRCNSALLRFTGISITVCRGESLPGGAAAVLRFGRGRVSRSSVTSFENASRGENFHAGRTLLRP
ncbi:hypothetical protein KCP73_20370 [Salmonella enterica subsp. enterica]|nr:hypothetical protein KCP73_20370 [Salmonella enterica subsp. enterica]